MKQIILLSTLLILGLIFCQYIPIIPNPYYYWVILVIKNITWIGLSYIMIQVGLEFSIERSRIKDYAWDYVVAFSAAALPWIFCSLYFIYAHQHDPSHSTLNIWSDSLLLGRFASPTSAGILLTMLASAGLGASWVFRKSRILAIFDDLDTILLLVPIKFMIIGFKWELIALTLLPICLMLYSGWKYLHSIILPINRYWILLYAIVITFFCEMIYIVTDAIEGILPMSIEVLLPAFILGCVLTCKEGESKIGEILDEKKEKRARLIISCIFMFFVGASLPPIEHYTKYGQELMGQVEQLNSFANILNYKIGSLTLGRVLLDVLVITFLANLGKMFPLFCYRKEARVWQRVSLSMGMCLRGEVGAGVIVISIGLITHLDPALILVAMLSLVLNFILTGPFILIIRKLHEKYGQLSTESE